MHGVCEVEEACFAEGEGVVGGMSSTVQDQGCEVAQQEQA